MKVDMTEWTGGLMRRVRIRHIFFHNSPTIVIPTLPLKLDKVYTVNCGTELEQESDCGVYSNCYQVSP